jgi:hypothetical protein
MKKRVLISTIVCSLMLGFSTANAKATKAELLNAQIKKEAKNHKKVPKEIIVGMQNTFKALKALQMGKKDDAQKFLQTAKDSFDKALKDNPKLDLVPIDERVQAVILSADSKEISKVLDTGIKLLKDHDTQAALNILAPLKDELDIAIINIPMKIYPIAESQALEALKKGNTQKAGELVAKAMNSLVVVKDIVPLPLLTAQNVVIEASQLDKTKKKEATELLEVAKEELKRAELLGYTKKHTPEYQALTKSINAIEKEIKGKNAVEKLYDKLKSDFAKLVHKTRGETFRDSVAKKAQEALINPKAIKGEKAAQTKVEKVQKKEQTEAKEKAKEFQQEVKKDLNSSK